jgi:hypothetical protein
MNNYKQNDKVEANATKLNIFLTWFDLLNNILRSIEQNGIGIGYNWTWGFNLDYWTTEFQC